MKLYYNPVSSYSQKALIAFYEKNAKFEPVVVNLMDAAGRAEYEKVYPMGKVPYLKVEDKGRAVPESTSIIEYIERHSPGGTKLIPDDPDAALEVRTWDRFFDCYVNDPMQKIFFDGMRPAGKNDPVGVQEARSRLDKAYAILEPHLANKTWAVGKDFTMADCAAAPPLGYARMVHPFEKFKNVTAYMNRLTERPSFQRALKEAEPILAAMNLNKK
jgi:glutathione S-transferase